MNDILGAGTQPGAVSDVWSMWTDEKDDEIFYLKCLGKRNCEKGTKWKLQGNKEDYSFDLIDADCGDLLPTEKNKLSHKFLKLLTKETKEYTYKELAAEFKCNFEHARRICIKLFTEGKTNIGRNNIPTFGGIGLVHFIHTLLTSHVVKIH